MVYESGYKHHKRMCLLSTLTLQKFGDICSLYLMCNEGKIVDFESETASKIETLSFQAMFADYDYIFRIELTLNELTAIGYCAEQVKQKCKYTTDWFEQAQEVKDYILRIKIGNDDSVFDKTVERPLQRKTRRL